MSEHPSKRKPRSIEELRALRSRDDGTLTRMKRLRLNIPDRVRADHPNMDFRFINDHQNRMYETTVEDVWDVVPGVDPERVDFRDGQPVLSYLCMKPLEFVDKDNAADEAAIRDKEKGILAGNVETEDASVTFYAGETNSIIRKAKL